VEFDRSDRLDDVATGLSSLVTAVDELRDDPPPPLKRRTLDALQRALADAARVVAELEEQAEAGRAAAGSPGGSPGDSPNDSPNDSPSDSMTIPAVRRLAEVLARSEDPRIDVLGTTVMEGASDNVEVIFGRRVADDMERVVIAVSRRQPELEIRRTLRTHLRAQWGS
jgi:hypothetical protein